MIRTEVEKRADGAPDERFVVVEVYSVGAPQSSLVPTQASISGARVASTTPCALILLDPEADSN